MKKLLKSVIGQNTITTAKRILNYFPAENQEVVKIRQEFYSQFISCNDLVFDVGANIGNRVKPMLNIGARVVAIEPQLNCSRILKRRFGNKIEIVKMGLGENEAVKDFYIANTNTISSFSIDWIESVKQERFKGFKWSTPIKMQLTTLDKLIEKYGKPKFIKIDVEGYEFEVIKGLNQPVDIISFEYTVPEQIQKAIDCVIQIEKYNPNALCNFSKGESMEFYLNDWQSISEFKKYLLTKEFVSTYFGDIYVKSTIGSN
jgi:FkbM family methyltransferase